MIEQVEIDGARRVALAAPPSESGLDPLHQRQEIAGFDPVSITATAFRNHGWSERGSGSLRYHDERWTIATPASANAASAAPSVSRGGPQRGVARLPPTPIR